MHRRRKHKDPTPQLAVGLRRGSQASVDSPPTTSQTLKVTAVKLFIQAVVLAAALASPIASFAQSNGPMTRAEVHVELVQLEQAGYNPGRAADPDYPADIQAAEARIAARNGETSGFGGTLSGNSASGVATAPTHSGSGGTEPIYFGH